MKHITSKLLSLLLTLAMLLSMIPAAYAEGTEGTTEGSTSTEKVVADRNAQRQHDRDEFERGNGGWRRQRKQSLHPR